jgi:hypothetical protein
MATKNVFISLVLISCLLANATATRDLAVKSESNAPATAETNSGGLFNCFIALMGFQFCSNNIFLTPSRGNANLSPVCCHAITTIANKCWPSMLASLGFQAKQGNNVLQGYCEAVSGASVADSLPKHMPPTI